MASSRRRGLGKGLDALIPQTPQTPDEASGLRQVSVRDIESNPRQPRTHFDEQKLAELADSIREVGLIQPLVVQQIPSPLGHSPRYQLIAGERRWRAAKLAGLAKIDVVIKDASPQEMLELALIENIQRDDLNPLEEALAYQQLASEFSLTQERIATRVGRSRASVANTMRLLRLPDEIQDSLSSGGITEGHARALLGLDEADEQLLALKTLVRRGYSVRQTEELVRRLTSTTDEPTRSRRRTPETVDLENQLCEALGTKVSLFRSRKGGRVVIHFYSEDDLQTLYDRLVPGE